MSEGSAVLRPSMIEAEIISDRYADVIITALKDEKYRYGLYLQENIPFLLLDFNLVDFAIPLMAVEMTEAEWNEFNNDKEIHCRISFRQERRQSSLFDANLDLDRALTNQLLSLLAEQRRLYSDPKQAYQMVNRLKGMVNADYMIRNAEMDTPWPYKALCRKLTPGRYWFTKKLSKKDKRIHLG